MRRRSWGEARLRADFRQVVSERPKGPLGTHQHRQVLANVHLTLARRIRKLAIAPAARASQGQVSADTRRNRDGRPWVSGRRGAF